MDSNTAIDEQVTGHSPAHRLVDDIESGPIETASRSVDRLIAWAESQRLRLITSLRDAGRSPLELLDGDSVHLTTASLTRAERRVDLLAAFPTFAEALSHGHISTSHLDRLGDALRRLLPHEREQLAADHTRLLLTARSGSAGQFARFLTPEVTRYERLRPTPDHQTGDSAADSAADPAEARFAAQQAGIRLTSHADRDTGMTIYRLALDPLRTLSFDRRLAARVEALHHGPPIPGCPTDPLERQAFLRAHALLQLLEPDQAGARTTNGAEVIVVVDHTAPGRAPDIDWGRDVEIPERVLHDLLGDPSTTIHEIVVRNGVIISAPGRLDLGRTTRLANRAQRRALRALHHSCAIPGCDVRFDHCTIHHIIWWRRGGRTDFANLLPLCSRHHHLVHDRGWHLSLGPNRELTVTTPSGRVMTTGPPRRWAA